MNRGELKLSHLALSSDLYKIVLINLKIAYLKRIKKITNNYHLI